MSAVGSVLDLSLSQLVLAFLLVGVVIAISVRQGLGVGRDLVVGSLRAVVQLYLVGLILAVVFRAAQWYWVLLILAVMTAVAAQAATSRLAKPMPAPRARRATSRTLGFSGRDAVQPMARTALRAAMIPTVNGMMTVGLVQLPGMMTGQILAGSSPLVAIRYQMVVVFMLAAATALGSLLFVRLAAGRYLTPAHQLRRYLL